MCPISSRKQRDHNGIIFFVLGFLLGWLPTFGAEYSWSAASGRLPNQVDPPMGLGDNQVTQPVLSPDGLLLQTVDYRDEMYYEHAGADLNMPTNLIIEAEVRYVSGASSSSGRAAIQIAFTTAPNVGGVLCIAQGLVFLSHDQDSSGPAATVATDDTFHLYRIEVDGTAFAGSPIRVYQDGVLLLSDTTLGPGLNVSGQPDIWFGDGTVSASGVSRWKSFRHNAGREPLRPALFVHSFSPSQVELCWNSRAGVLYDLQYCSDLSSPVWTNLSTNIVGAGSNCILDVPPPGTSARYYRISLLP